MIPVVFKVLVYMIFTQKATFLTPEMTSWDQLNNTSFKTYYLVKGDYSHLGNLIIDGRKGIKIIGDSSVVAGIDARRSDSILIEGVVITTFPIALRNSPFSVVQNNWIYVDRRNGLRVLNKSHHTIIQNNHFEILDFPKRDMGAIVLQAQNHNCRVLNNRIINFVDGIVTFDQRNIQNDLQGLLIEGNDIFVDDRIRFEENGEEFAMAENAIDLKVGSLNEDNPVVIKGNRLHGHRWTRGSGSGSGGEEIVIHRWAKNIVITGNKIYDGVAGIRVGSYYVDGKIIKPNDRKLTISNNKFYNIHKRCKRSTGAVFNIAAKTHICGNDTRSYDTLIIEKNLKVDMLGNCLTSSMLDELED